MKKQDKRQEKQIESNEVCKLESAGVLLQIYMDEYSKQFEAKKSIENKIVALLTIEMAVLTVFMPIIPFDTINKMLAGENNALLIMKTIACVLLVEGVVAMLIVFVWLIYAIRMRIYKKVDIEKLGSENIMMSAVDELEKGLCDHYKVIVLQNEEIDAQKAKDYQKCLPFTVIGFVLLLVGTIILKLL